MKPDKYKSSLLPNPCTSFILLELSLDSARDIWFPMVLYLAPLVPCALTSSHSPSHFWTYIFPYFHTTYTFISLPLPWPVVELLFGLACLQHPWTRQSLRWSYL